MKKRVKFDIFILLFVLKPRELMYQARVVIQAVRDPSHAAESVCR